MSKWLRFCRRGLTFGVACGVVMVALAGQAARAGNVTIYISEGALTPVSFDFTSPLALGTDMNHLLADAAGPGVGALNLTLAALGYDFAFQTLSANSNLPGLGGAQLFMTGQVERITTGGGDKTIQIDVSQNDYLTSPALILHNSVTGNFTNAPAGNNQLGTSYFNTSNVQDDTSGPHTTTLTYTSTGTAPNAHPGPGEQGGSSVAVNSAPPFSLTGRLVITLGQLSDVQNPPTDQFTISTTVSVPEPASIALMGMGLPVAIVGLGWLRRRKAAA